MLVIVVAGLLASCEKPILAGQEGEIETKGNLKVSVYELEQTPFNSTLRGAVSELCTHLNFAIYDRTGERLKQVNQMVGDSELDASDIIVACDYKEEEITLKEFQEDKILLNIPVYFNIEKLRKVLG